MLEADLHLPSVQRVCEDVQAAHHDGGITSCKSNIECLFGKSIEGSATQVVEPYQREKSCV